MATGKKTDGREKGTPNKVIKELRDKLKPVLVDELENLPAELAKMLPRQRIELIIKLLPYSMSKVQPLTADYDIFTEAELVWGAHER